MGDIHPVVIPEKNQLAFIRVDKNVRERLGMVDGICYGMLDLCLNFTQIFNTAVEFHTPLKFFSTGEMIPDDIESATPERVLAGMFKLK